MNKVELTGRITKDIELKTTQSGLFVCSFTLAVDRRRDANGNKQADFISCTAWRKTAEVLSQYCHKGSKIGITGSLQTRSYDDQNGNKRTVTEVLVEELEFLDSKQASEQKPVAQTEVLPIPPVPSEDPNLPFSFDF